MCVHVRDVDPMFHSQLLPAPKLIISSGQMVEVIKKLCGQDIVVAMGSVFGMKDSGMQWHNNNLRDGYALLSLKNIHPHDRRLSGGVSLPWEELPPMHRKYLHLFQCGDIIAWPVEWLRVIGE